MEIVFTELKQCNDCGEYKPLSEFYAVIRNGRKPSHKGNCKECCSLRAKERQLKRLAKRPKVAEARRANRELVKQGLRLCSLCRTAKPFTEYYVRASRPGQYQAYCMECADSRRKQRWSNDQEYRRRVLDQTLRKNYGISAAEYDAMYAAQDGRCAICNEEETAHVGRGRPTNRLAVDHCHKTGKVRGLLCRSCNTGIGHLGDNVERLFAAVVYLEQNSEEIADGEVQAG